MVRGWQVAATVALAITASACSRANQVHSRTSLVTEAAPLALRRGIWAAPESDCVFDAERSFRTWPDCAHGARKGGDAFNTPWVLQGIVLENRLAPGDPMIRQTRWRVLRETEEQLFDFEAVRPLRRDAKGRITAFEAWTVMCGPPVMPATAPSPGDDAPASTGPAASSPLLPGLEAREGSSGCLARDLDSVRRAAAATREEGWDEPRRHRYVRPFRFRDNFGRPTEPPPAPPGVAPDPQSG